jgi:hypothetical protein
MFIVNAISTISTGVNNVVIINVAIIITILLLLSLLLSGLLQLRQLVLPVITSSGCPRFERFERNRNGRRS